VDVEVAVGEPFQSCNFITVVVVLEVDVEVVKKVLDDGDIL